jgi:hypothetical protein
MNKKCKICKSVFSGRENKLFCCIKCKNVYHQSLRAVTKKTALSIDKHLHRNRSILLEIMGKTNTQMRVPKQLLNEKNFHFKYITHYHINAQGKTMHFCYDFGYMEFSDDSVLIVRNKIS